MFLMLRFKQFTLHINHIPCSMFHSNPSHKIPNIIIRKLNLNLSSNQNALGADRNLRFVNIIISKTISNVAFDAILVKKKKKHKKCKYSWLMAVGIGWNNLLELCVSFFDWLVILVLLLRLLHSRTHLTTITHINFIILLYDSFSLIPNT